MPSVILPYFVFLFNFIQRLFKWILCYLRSFGANRVLTTALHQKETNSLVSSGQSMDKWGITTSKNDHSIDSSDNQKSSTPFLKRKTIEVWNFQRLLPFEDWRKKSSLKWFDTHNPRPILVTFSFYRVISANVVIIDSYVLLVHNSSPCTLGPHPFT